MSLFKRDAKNIKLDLSYKKMRPFVQPTLVCNIHNHHPTVFLSSLNSFGSHFRNDRAENDSNMRTQFRDFSNSSTVRVRTTRLLMDVFIWRLLCRARKAVPFAVMTIAPAANQTTRYTMSVYLALSTIALEYYLSLVFNSVRVFGNSGFESITLNG